MTTLIDTDALIGRHPRIDAGGGTVGELLAAMDRCGIAEAVVGHTMSWLHDPATGNRRVSCELAGADRLAPCWAIPPDECFDARGAGRFVTAARDAGVAAVRAYPADHGYDLPGPDAAPVLAALAGAGLPLLVSATQTSWPAVEAAAAAHPHLPVVVGQAGYRTLRQLVGVLDRCPNVLVGLGNLSSHGGLEWLVERFGASRLVFGTGTPEFDPASAVTRLLLSELPDAAVAAIGSDTYRSLGGAR